MYLPRKIMEQCRPCPAKLWNNADFAPQNHRAFVLFPAKSRRLCSLPRKIMEQCRLCSAKSQIHSFRGQQITSNINFIIFFLIIFVNHCYFRDLYNPLDRFLRKNILCHGTFKSYGNFAEKSEFFLLDNVVKLVGGGSVINGPTLFGFWPGWMIF